jgi:hypothetical protein
MLLTDTQTQPIFWCVKHMECSIHCASLQDRTTENSPYLMIYVGLLLQLGTVSDGMCPPAAP